MKIKEHNAALKRFKAKEEEGLRTKHQRNYASINMFRRVGFKLYAIVGDGNCLFRCLSFYLYGT